MGGEESSIPVDNASFSQEEPDFEQMDYDMNQMDMKQGENDMNNETPMDDAPVNDDSTMGIINQLSSDDKDAVRSYAESLLKKYENEEEPIDDGLNMEAPVGGNMSESVIFTKGQLRAINENFQ